MEIVEEVQNTKVKMLRRVKQVIIAKIENIVFFCFNVFKTASLFFKIFKQNLFKGTVKRNSKTQISHLRANRKHIVFGLKRRPSWREKVKLELLKE